MLVTNFQIDSSPASTGFIRVSAEIRYDKRPGFSERVWYDLPAANCAGLEVNGNPWLVALLPVAAAVDEPLHIDAPIDFDLKNGAREMLAWWHYWFPAMSIIAIQGSAIAAHSGDMGQRTAQFFSGGVDSWFTLLRHEQEDDTLRVDDLLTGWGFDIPIDDRPAFDRLCSHLQLAADRLGKRLVPFATNIRQTRFGELPWGSISHGGAMASAALFMGHAYRRVLIPSSLEYRESGAWGSHFAVDHLYSTHSIRLHCDGSASTRLQKTALISSSAAALSSLRVCWRSNSDSNCGQCEKCLRTMLALELCGNLSAAPTFSHARLESRDIRRIYCPREPEGSPRIFYEEMLAEARRQGRTDLSRALTKALARSDRLRLLGRLADRLSRSAMLGGIGKTMRSHMARRTIK